MAEEAPKKEEKKDPYNYGPNDKPKGAAKVIQEDPLDIFPSDDPDQSTTEKGADL